MSSPESPGPAAGLSYNAVIAAAREILADDGLNAVTMPAVARRLGVSPEVLHSHVPTQDILVAGLVDGILDSVELPDDDVIDATDPIDALREISIASYDALLANAELIPSLLKQGGPGGEKSQFVANTTIALLSRTGLTDWSAVGTASQVLSVYTVGSAAFAAASPSTTDEDIASRAQLFDDGLRWLLAQVGR